jgi:hypothetical protein
LADGDIARSKAWVGEKADQEEDVVEGSLTRPE